jgi:autotransporter-associated beta strand protein
MKKLFKNAVVITLEHFSGTSAVSGAGASNCSQMKKGSRGNATIRRTLAHAAAVAAAAFSMCGTAQAVGITWGAPATISADTDILNAGALVTAAVNGNIGATTVNGVPFTNNNSKTNLNSGAVTMSGYSGSTYYSFGTPSGISAAYGKLTGGGAYSSAATAAINTLNGLTLNHVYAVQVWVNDSRSYGNGRTETLTSNGGNTITLDYNSTEASGGAGQYSIGQFTASGTSQAFTNKGSASTQLNAIQLRDVTGVWSGQTDGAWAGGSANFSGGQDWTAVSGLIGGGTVYFADTDGFRNAIVNSTVSIQAEGVSAGTVVFQNGGISYTLRNSSGATGITGSTAISKTGAGGVTLDDVNTYSGGTAVGAGVLAIGNAGALGSGLVTLSAGTLSNTTALASGSGVQNAISLAGAATVNTGSGDLLLSGVISGGSGGLVKDGAGNLTLTAVNTYTVPTTIRAGALTISGTGGLGGGTYAGAIANSGVLTYNSSAAQVLSGTITGAGSLTQSGSGTLTLANNSSSFTGGITITNGTLAANPTSDTGASTSSVLGARTPSNIITVGNGCVLTTTQTQNNWIDGVSSASDGSAAHTVVINAGGRVANSTAGRITGIGNLTLNGGTLECNNGYSSWGAAYVLLGDVTAGGATTSRITKPGTSCPCIRLTSADGSRTFNVGSGSTLAIATPLINGNGYTSGLTKTGPGTLALSGVNAYSDATMISAGTVTGVTGGSCSNSAVTVSAGSGQAAALGVSVASTNTQWVCASLTVSNGGTSSDLEFAFGAAVPSTTLAPLMTTGSVIFTTTPAIKVSGVALEVTSGNGYPLLTWGSGPAPSLNGVTLTLPQRTTGNLAIEGSTLYLQVTEAAGPISWTGGSGTWDINNGGNTPWKDSKDAVTHYQEMPDGDRVAFDTSAGTGGTVTLNTNVSPASVTVNNTGADYTVSGSGGIGGGGSLAKQGTGTLTLSVANTYSGATTVSGGTLKAGSPDAIPTNSALTVNAGTFDLNGNNVTAALAAANAAGTITDNSAGSGISTLTLNVAANSAYNPLLKDGGNGQKLGIVFSAAGNGAIQITGLNSANTFTGGLTFKNVTFAPVSEAAIGAGGPLNPILIGQTPADYGQLCFSSYSATISSPIVINSNRGGSGGPAAFWIYGGNNTYITLAGTITLNTTAGFINNGGYYNNRGFIITGKITGAGGLNIGRNGYWMSVALANPTPGANDFGGDVTVIGANGNATLFKLGASAQIPDSSSVVLDSTLASACFDLSGNNETINGLSTAGTNPFRAYVTSSGAATLTVGANNASGNFSGSIQNAISLAKAGTGTLTLSGSNTYTGATTIINGCLKLAAAGSISNSPLISVVSGGTFDVGAVSGGFTIVSGQTLKGTGSVTGNVTVADGGILVPGNPKGTLLVKGDVTLGATSTFVVNCDSSGYGQLQVTNGVINLASATLSVVQGSEICSENMWIINNQGGSAISGTFNGLPEDSVLKVNGQLFKIHYSADFASQASTGGNDVCLKAIIMPRVKFY